ncbi:MAG TPA: hypothetical protein VN924_22590 [Bryobacteraceae bacterium]|nr:hypothetical protein [Bryobacteraceae bacterium]
MTAVALGRDFEFKVDRSEVCPTGLSEVDTAVGGLPQGCLTEVYGPSSSGRTSLMLAAMAQSTSGENVCALVDASDAFDPASAAAAGVLLERLLWVRCGGNAEHALKAADLLVQGGGFGLVVMDLADTPVISARRISMTSWFRLRRAVEHTPTVLLVLEQQPHAKTCASLTLEMRREWAVWSGANAGDGTAGELRSPEPAESRLRPRLAAPQNPNLLRGIRVQVDRRKPVPAIAASFESRW